MIGNKEITAAWIWTPDWTEEDRSKARLVYFTRTLQDKDILPEEKGSRRMSITADCRYKLYVNGELIQYGPAKGDHEVHYLDSVAIGRYLHEGDTRLDIAVLHYPEDPGVGNHGIFSSDTPGLYLEGISCGDWSCRVDRTSVFDREEKRFAPLQIHEKRSLRTADGKDWVPAIVRGEEEMPAYLRRETLHPRPIPPMDLKRHVLELPVRKVEPDTEETFVLDAGEEMCGFVKLAMRGGSGSEIRLLYSECYEGPEGRGDRTDAEHGKLYGYEDFLRIGESGGSGELSAPDGMSARVFEPFWFRTFRFMQVTVRTGNEPLLLDACTYLETGYPLKVRTQVQTSDGTLGPIWDLSLRTLRRCMHETYVDCPYYEQLQYIMDTRSEILYTYAVSADDRLARKAIGEFARAQRPDGLLNCSYPNKNTNVIPGFPLYYILMVHDHMMYFGDVQLVRSVLPVVRRILDFFGSRTISGGPWHGLVSKTGGVNGEGELWSFIDWAQEWMETTGMPQAGLHGPLTMESLLYILGLQKAAELEDFAGDAALAAQDRSEAGHVQEAVLRACLDEEGFLTDGPVHAADGTACVPADCRKRSQHCQVFGILTGTLGAEQGRRDLERSLTEEGFARCSVAMRFYLFRALEQAGLYEYTDRLWDVWREMVRNHCSTSVEGEFYPRSECHAWGALALYELPSVVLGVRPTAPGYSRIEVRPCPGTLTWAAGTVHTPVGDVKVSWHRTADGIEVQTERIDGKESA